MTVSHSHPGGMQRVERVIRVPKQRQSEALERLVSAGTEPARESARRFIEYASQARISLDAMWACLDDRGRIERTLLAVPSPGRTAMLFVSRPRRPEDVAPAAELIERGSSELGGLGVHLAQVLLDPRDELERQAYEAGGFTFLATLSYLERAIPAPGQAPRCNLPEDVSLQPCTDPHDARWVQALEASYEDTMDCPGLLGLRDTADIIEGHRSVGEFEPGLWTLMSVGDQPAGVLMLNPTPTNRTIELVYLGLAPFARGRGLATQLLRHGLALVAGRPERMMTLAVDEQNTPAIRLYQREGFRRTLRRIAYIRSARSKPASWRSRASAPGDPAVG